MNLKLWATVALAVGLLTRGSSAAAPVEPSQEPVSGAEEVLIPAGDLRMGSEVSNETQPIHEVSIDAFYLETHEVTNAQYFAFCQATGRGLPAFWDKREFRSGPSFPDHPVVGVSWYAAAAYAKWAGKRLPTEAEWEYAARGGLIGKPYPSGETLDATAANYSASGPVAMRSYRPNGFGLYDMAGNVWEWVADGYDPTYYARSPQRNPPGPDDRRLRVIRGGGWRSGPTCNRVDYRNALPPGWVDMAVGFRCARDVPPR